MSKFFAAVLNQRLLKYALEKGVISKNQLGFMPGNRCSDALIILYNLFNRYCLRDSKYIYMLASSTLKKPLTQYLDISYFKNCSPIT